MTPKSRYPDGRGMPRPARLFEHAFLLKGVFDIDEQTKKQGADAEERFLKSYPFHPDPTEVFYGKWTQLDRFQRTRGVLRTFALALREAERWDTSPLVGPAVFLAGPEKSGASVSLADSGPATETVAPPLDSITVQNAVDYFKGGNVIQVQRNGYMEPLAIPKAEPSVVNDAVTKAVEEGRLWLTNGPASVLGEPIPAGVLTGQAVLHRPPAMIAPAEILPGNLPDAWTDDATTALAIATVLSQKSGQTLPWKTVRDVITASLNARFTELDPTSGAWPCEYPSAQGVKLKVATGGGKGGYGGGGGFGGGEVHEENVKWAEAELEPSEVQDIGDAIPQLLAIKSKSGCPITFKVHITVGDADNAPDEATIAEINQVLDDLRSGFQLS